MQTAHQIDIDYIVELEKNLEESDGIIEKQKIMINHERKMFAGYCAMFGFSLIAVAFAFWIIGYSLGMKLTTEKFEKIIAESKSK